MCALDDLLIAGHHVIGGRLRVVGVIAPGPGQPISLMPIIITTVDARGWLSTDMSKRLSALVPMPLVSTRSPEYALLTTATSGCPSACSRSAT